MISIKQEGQRMVDSVFNLAEIKLRLFTLGSADKGSRIATGFFTIVILTLVFIFSMILISIGVAILLAKALHSAATGFFIVGGFYILIGIILLAFRKQIIYGPLLNAILNTLVGAELKAENKMEKVQDKVEDKLNLPNSSN